MNDLQKKIQKSEGRLAHYKNEKDKLQEEIAKNPFFNAKERGKRLKELNALIEEEENAWLDLQEKLEKLKP